MAEAEGPSFLTGEGLQLTRHLLADSTELLGLADRLVAQDQVRATALEMAREIARAAPLSVQATRETLNADIPLTVDHFRYFAGCLRAQEGALSQIDDHTVAYHFHEPLGVVGQIIPWNFPILMAVWKLAPALAAGNCVVLKPAEQTPLTMLRLAELGERAGLPPRLHSAFRAGVDAFHGLEFDGGDHDRERFQEHMIQRFLTASHTASRDDTDYLLERMDRGAEKRRSASA